MFAPSVDAAVVNWTALVRMVRCRDFWPLAHLCCLQGFSHQTVAMLEPFVQPAPAETRIVAISNLQQAGTLLRENTIDPNARPPQLRYAPGLLPPTTAKTTG